MLTLNCPSCRYTGKAPDKYAGKTVACPRCQAKIKVPELEDLEEELPAQGRKWWWIGVVAVLAVGVGIGLLVSPKETPKPTERREEVASKPQLTPTAQLTMQPTAPAKEPLDLTSERIKVRFDLLPLERRRLLIQINDYIISGTVQPMNLHLLWKVTTEHQEMFDSRLLPWACKVSGATGADELMKILELPQNLQNSVRIDFMAACWAIGEMEAMLIRSNLPTDSLINGPKGILDLARKYKAGGMNALTEKEKQFVVDHHKLFNIK